MEQSGASEDPRPEDDAASPAPTGELAPTGGARTPQPPERSDTTADRPGRDAVPARGTAPDAGHGTGHETRPDAGSGDAETPSDAPREPAAGASASGTGDEASADRQEPGPAGADDADGAAPAERRRSAAEPGAPGTPGADGDRPAGEALPATGAGAPGTGAASVPSPPDAARPGDAAERPEGAGRGDDTPARREPGAPVAGGAGAGPRAEGEDPAASGRKEPAGQPGETPSGRTLAGGHGPVKARDAQGDGRDAEPRSGLLMGRPFGVPVYVSPSFFLVAALITWVFGDRLEPILPDLGAARYLVSLSFALALYASVLVHELAHTVAALRFKLPVRRIQLQFFGGFSDIGKESETPGREFVLAFVGPLLSLVLAGLFYLSLLAVEPGTVPGVLLGGLMISNLIVAAFNLLPGLPLDGGRMLRAVVWKITGRPMSGTVAAAWAGRALAVAVLIGFPLLTRSGAVGEAQTEGMDTVLDALLAAIVAAIMWTGAGNSLRMARLREHLPDLRARTLTRRAVPVQPDTSVSEALRRANAAGARALVVVDASGVPVSLVRESGIAGVPEHRRPWVAVSTLATGLTEGMRISAELEGEELLEALRTTPATEYLVVEETGEIYGVLSAADVEQAFVKAMTRPR
ncbi:site-2 protease family protein [Streptomyces chilikensis]|uniref:Site-2 protease family protein n=1 Tax=Streptomyces chilikensis TaxID=1194079 RepID=A0ABV3EWZ0_9ACTN